MGTNYDTSTFGSESRDVPDEVFPCLNSSSSSGACATRELDMFISTVRTIDSPFGKVLLILNPALYIYIIDYIYIMLKVRLIYTRNPTS